MWLDILRLLTTAAYAVVILGVIDWALGLPASDVPDKVPIFVFLVAPGAMGAAAAAVADLVVTDHERRSHAHLISGR